MRFNITPVLLFLAAAVPAAAQDVRIKNDSDTPIYQLFAWASDLTPSTENLIAFPIRVGEIRTVDIDNHWSDCNFTVLIDPNSPDDSKNKSYIKKDMYINAIDICHRGGKPISLRLRLPQL